MNQSSPGPLQTWLTPALRSCDGVNDCQVLRSYLSIIRLAYSDDFENEEKHRSKVSYTDEINEKVKAHLDGFLPQQAQQGQTASRHLPGLRLGLGTHSWHPLWGLAPGRSRYRSDGCFVSFEQKCPSSVVAIQLYSTKATGLGFWTSFCQRLCVASAKTFFSLDHV